eukprot:2934761-Rhodomonas_salina.1
MQKSAARKPRVHTYEDTIMSLGRVNKGLSMNYIAESTERARNLTQLKGCTSPSNVSRTSSANDSRASTGSSPLSSAAGDFDHIEEEVEEQKLPGIENALRSVVDINRQFSVLERESAVVENSVAAAERRKAAIVRKVSALLKRARELKFVDDTEREAVGPMLNRLMDKML